MLNFLWSSLALLWFVGSSLATAKLPEIAAIRTYFFVGGGYVEDGPGRHLFSHQMYVEKLVPADGPKHKVPLVFIHGIAQTGTNWLNTPDDRRGWASWFVQHGYVVYIVDKTQRGRSAYTPGDGSLGSFAAEDISRAFTASKKFNLWPEARLQTQWVGTGERGDPIFDAFYASNVPFQNDLVITQTTNKNAGAALLDRIGPAILVTHSQGGPDGFLIADARPSLVRALVALEPYGPPFVETAIFSMNPGGRTRPYALTTIPITYSPPIKNVTTDLATVNVRSTNTDQYDCLLQASSTPRKLINLAKIPMILVTAEASYHAPYDFCTVRYLRQAGVNVEHLELGKAGFHGNGHLFFLEKNNLAIAARLELWIRKYSSPVAKLRDNLPED